MDLTKHDDALAYWNAQSAFRGGWQDREGRHNDILTTDPMRMLSSPENTIILINLVLTVVAILTLPGVWKQIEPRLARIAAFIVIFHAV